MAATLRNMAARVCRGRGRGGEGLGEEVQEGEQEGFGTDP